MSFFITDDVTSTKKPNLVAKDNDATAKVMAYPRSVETLSSQKDDVSNSSSTSKSDRIRYNSSIDGSTSDVNLLNDQFLKRLEDDKDEIVFLMRHSAIEDGYDNEVVQFVRPYYEENNYLTLLWLYKLYSEYLEDDFVFSSILDLLSCLGVKQSDMNFMISLVCNGLNSKLSLVQEAALKVIEKWRSRECLMALRQASFNSKWISTYAAHIMCELQRELQ